MNLKIFLVFLVLAVAEETCSSDSDCMDLNKCISSRCQHKSLFPLAKTEYIGLVVMVTISILANAGGVGGSAMTISLILLTYKFDPHSCVALTQVFTFAGTSTATILKLKDRHPTCDKPLIYYDVLMQIVSPILIGVSIGVLLNPSFPGWLILTILTVIIFLLGWDTLKRIIALYKKEKRQTQVETEPDNARVQASGFSNTNFDSRDSVVKRDSDVEGVKIGEIKKTEEENDEKNDEEVNDENNQEGFKENGDSVKIDNIEKSVEDNDNLNSPQQLLGSKEIDPELMRKLTTIYQEDKKIIAWVPLLYFLVLVSVSITYSLIKGSSTSKSIIGIKSCSSSYFSIASAYYIFMFLMSILAAFYLVRKSKILEAANHNFGEGEIKWNYKKCLKVEIFSILSGIILGLLGLGGGNLIGPMLLSMGVRPEVSTISTSFSIALSSGVAAAMYFITGVVDYQYAAWFYLLSVVGCLVGVLVVRRIAIRKQRVSSLIFCQFVILFVSFIIIPIVGTLNAIKQSDEGTFQIGFKSFC